MFETKNSVRQMMKHVAQEIEHIKSVHSRGSEWDKWASDFVARSLHELQERTRNPIQALMIISMMTDYFTNHRIEEEEKKGIDKATVEANRDIMMGIALVYDMLSSNEGHERYVERLLNVSTALWDIVHNIK